MPHSSLIPVVVERSRPEIRSDPPRLNPSGIVPPWTSDPLFHEWTSGYTELRGLADFDGDESMSSSTSSFDTTSPLTTTGEFTGTGSAPWPSPSLTRFDPETLLAIGQINLRDGLVSPMPASLLESVGEETREDGLDIGGLDMFDMELHPPPSVEEDTVRANFLPNHVVPTALAQELSSFPFPAHTDSVFPGRNTEPNRKNYHPPSSISSHQGDVVRRVSLKRSRSQRRSSDIRDSFCGCALPDRPKQGQKLLLPELPIEILLVIFQYSMLWPPTKLPKCEHQLAPRRLLARRATTVDSRARHAHLHTSSLSSAGPSSSSYVPGTEPELDLSETLEQARKFSVRTLIKISHTCRYFYGILTKKNDSGWTDEAFWSVAAHTCWEWLPNLLGEVQGHGDGSQTSWRNVVEVFMQSENPLFAQRKEGKAGVDCFGGNKACHLAASWSMEKIRRQQIERDGSRPKSLLLACAQPGPDHFTVTPDEDTKSWTVALSLSGGEYMVYLDEYGRFGRPGKLPEDLRKSDNVGHFAPDIFEDRKDRFRLVKVQVRRELHASRFPTRSQEKPIQEIVTWDLSSIPEYVADRKARVARCASHSRVLLCSLFTHRNPSELDELVDPPEDCRVFCVEAKEQNYHTGMDLDGMSSKKRGKLPEKPGSGTVFRWQREFVYRNPAVVTSTRRLHYVICNLCVNEKTAVVMIRWNQSTPTSAQEFYDDGREFRVLNPQSGEALRVFEFPNLYWDYRHHDMDRRYNAMRVNKLYSLYNPPPSQSMGSGNRATRIHQDAFFITDNHMISGSHDYCNWVWDLHKPECKEGTFTAEHNDASHITEPFEVLDDYYWNSTCKRGVPWASHNERAGWWVKTPNQVLCYWHGAALGLNQDRFATCRTGKMFVWDLSATDKNLGIKGYTNLAPGAGERQGWLGKLKGENSKMEGWHLYDDVVPEQGLWLLYDDDEAVFIDREEIFEACGLEHETWRYERDAFVFEEEKEPKSGEMEECDDDDVAVEEVEDSEVKGKRRKIGYEPDRNGVPLWDYGINID